MEQVVHVFEPAGDAGHGVLLLGQLRQLLERLGEQYVHALERGRNALLGDVEQRLLGFFDHDAQVVGRIVGQGLDLARSADEVAQDGRALDDFQVVLPVGEREGVVRKLDEVRFAAHGLQLAHGFQVVGERDVVDGDMAHVQVHHGLVDMLMREAVEVLLHQLWRHLFDGLLVQHASGEDGPFRFDVLGVDLATVGCGAIVRCEVGAVRRG